MNHLVQMKVTIGVMENQKQSPKGVLYVSHRRPSDACAHSPVARSSFRIREITPELEDPPVAPCPPYNHAHTPAAGWRSFHKALTVLLLFHLRYQPC